MASENIISAIGYFDGQTSKGNFDVNLKARFSESVLPNALQFVAGIGKMLQLIAVVENKKVKIGKFTVYNIRIDNNGNSVVTFKSNKDSAFVENIPEIMIDEAAIEFKAKILDE